ncbi:MAG: hypothetical protein KF830_10580 [Planctomycetes bacterium]|nr:hypothetical protein [Planctomycetota bacterium]
MNVPPGNNTNTMPVPTDGHQTHLGLQLDRGAAVQLARRHAVGLQDRQPRRVPLLAPARDRQLLDPLRPGESLLDRSDLRRREGLDVRDQLAQRVVQVAAEAPLEQLDAPPARLAVLLGQLAITGAGLLDQRTRPAAIEHRRLAGVVRGHVLQPRAVFGSDAAALDGAFFEAARDVAGHSAQQRPEVAAARVSALEHAVWLEALDEHLLRRVGDLGGERSAAPARREEQADRRLVAPRERRARVGVAGRGGAQHGPAGVAGFGRHGE